MTTKLTYGLTQYLRDDDALIAGVKRDLARLKSYGYTPGDFASLRAKRKAVDGDRTAIGKAHEGVQFEHAHVATAREQGYQTVVHAHDLVRIGLRAGDFGTDPAQKKIVHDKVGLGLHLQHVSGVVADQGRRVLAGLADASIAASMKKRGWTAADTTHLADSVAALEAAARDGVEQGALEGDLAALADAEAYARLVGHSLWKGNAAKLAAYRISKKALAAIAAPPSTAKAAGSTP